MTIDLIHYLILSAFVFCSGLLVVIAKRSAVFALMGIELMLNGAHINLAAFSRFDQLLNGQILAVFSVVLTAAEVTISIAILLNIYKKHQTSDLTDLRDLKH